MYRPFDLSSSGPRVDARFDRTDRLYGPGSQLEARYRAHGFGAEPVRAVEHSIAWYTEGKGEEDLVVHCFERLEPNPSADAALEGVLTTRLPASPLSYEGVIVKIRWCLRVRIFFAGGRDFVSEHVFTVGTLPPARPAAVPAAQPEV